jgi:hypothetical protein
VLLGDVLELRHGPPRKALARAIPVVERLGRALGEGELIVVAGNHDHALVEPWVATQALAEPPAALGLEHLIGAEEASPMLAMLARRAAPAQLRAAYPGLWLRGDVYATHGHYLDCHITVPTLERLAISLAARVLGRPPAAIASVEDYEAVEGPVLALAEALARYETAGSALNGTTTARAWRALAGDSAGSPASVSRALRKAILTGGFGLAVAALNQAGMGPYRADVSGAELRRAGLEAIGQVAARLGLGEVDLIFGHTHRAGPLAGDDLAEWTTPTGTRLANCGCWTFGEFLRDSGSSENPYWPGSCIVVEQQGPPRLERLLADRSWGELTGGLRPGRG